MPVQQVRVCGVWSSAGVLDVDRPLARWLTVPWSIPFWLSPRIPLTAWVCGQMPPSVKPNEGQAVKLRTVSDFRWFRWLSFCPWSSLKLSLLNYILCLLITSSRIVSHYMQHYLLSSFQEFLFHCDMGLFCHFIGFLKEWEDYHLGPIIQWSLHKNKPWCNEKYKDA